MRGVLESSSLRSGTHAGGQSFTNLIVHDIGNLLLRNQALPLRFRVVRRPGARDVVVIDFARSNERVIVRKSGSIELSVKQIRTKCRPCRIIVGWLLSAHVGRIPTKQESCGDTDGKIELVHCYQSYVMRSRNDDSASAGEISVMEPGTTVVIDREAPQPSAFPACPQRDQRETILCYYDCSD